jgi:hypothetical protein
MSSDPCNHFREKNTPLQSYQSEIKCNCKDKTDEYNKNISLFMNKLLKLCQTCSQMVKWVDQSYRWIEERYLRNSIKDTKKSLLKRGNIQVYLIINIGKGDSPFKTFPGSLII